MTAVPLGQHEPGLCACGCGQPTKIATKTDSSRGVRKGQPLHYLNGHAGPPPQTDAEIERRFWSWVDRRGPDECWPWRGGRNEKGYGKFSLNDRHQAAHRFALTLRIGPIPAGLLARHRCDNPPCCNPDHLLPGGHQDNADDKVARGRSLRGSAQPGAKLNEAAVSGILQALAAGRGQGAIASQFGVSDSTIGWIASGALWAHVPRPT